MATYKDVLMLVDKVSEPLKKIQKNTDKLREKTGKLQNAFEKLKGKLGSIGTGFSNLGGKLKAIGGKFAKFAKIAVAAFAAVAAATAYALKRTVEYGDRIDKMSQKIGMSRKAFQEWDYIMSQNGGSVETLQMGFKTLTTQIEGVQKGSKDSIAAFRALGVSVKDSNGQFRSQDDIFNDTVRKLQQIKNPTQKAMLANRLFGRSAAELRPLLNQEADAVDELRAKANRLGLIVSDKDIDNSVKLKDTFDTLSRAVQARFASVMMKIMPYITKALEVITPLVNKVYNYFAKLFNAFKSSPAFMQMKVQFQELGETLQKFYNEHQDFFNTLKQVFEWFITTGLPNLLTSIAFITKALVNITSFVMKFFKGIGALIGNIIGYILSIPIKIQTAFIQAQTIIIKVFQAIKTGIGNAITFIIERLVKLLNTMASIASKIPGLKGLGSAFSNLANNINKNTVNQTQNNNTTNNTTNITNNYNRGTVNPYMTPANAVPVA